MRCIALLQTMTMIFYYHSQQVTIMYLFFGGEGGHFQLISLFSPIFFVIGCLLYDETKSDTFLKIFICFSNKSSLKFS